MWQMCGCVLLLLRAGVCVRVYRHSSSSLARLCQQECFIASFFDTGAEESICHEKVFYRS